MIDEKRLAEIREILGPRTADESRGAFPIEDAADDLLAMLDATRADLAALLAATVERDAAVESFVEYLEFRTPEWNARLSRMGEAERVYSETVARLVTRAALV